MQARRGACGPVTFTVTVMPVLSPGPGARAWLDRVVTAEYLQKLANAAHKLDDCDQLSSASATPVPARPSQGEGRSQGAC